MFKGHPFDYLLNAYYMLDHVVEKPGEQNWQGPYLYSKYNKDSPYTGN